MTQQSQARPLCPHLAAAVLWMTKPNRKPRRGTAKLRCVRAYGAAADHMLAL